MLIKHIIKKNHCNGRTTIIMKCPQCDAWGHVIKDRRRMLVRHETKTGYTCHRITGELFEETRLIFEACGRGHF